MSLARYRKCPLCSDDWHCSKEEYDKVVEFLDREMPGSGPDPIQRRLDLEDDEYQIARGGKDE